MSACPPEFGLAAHRQDPQPERARPPRRKQYETYSCSSPPTPWASFVIVGEIANRVSGVLRLWVHPDINGTPSMATISILRASFWWARTSSERPAQLLPSGCGVRTPATLTAPVF